jgi:hypothetical protein
MTCTEYGFCTRCDERVELVPFYAGEELSVLGCHKCGNLGVK